MGMVLSCYDFLLSLHQNFNFKSNFTNMNILDMLKDQVTGTLAKQASGFLGESEGAVQSALGSAFPAILGSVINKGSSKSGAEGLMGMIGGLDLDMLGNIGNIFGGGASSVNGLLNSGGGILESLLGNKLGGVVDLIAKVSGLKGGSSSSLLKMAAPLLMGLIGKQIKGKGIGGLMDLLTGQKAHVAKAMPSGMGNLLGFANLGKITDGVKDVAGAATGAVGSAANLAGNTARAAAGTATDAAKSGFGWLKAALPILLLGVLAWWFMNKGGVDKMKDVATSAVETTKGAANAVTDGVADAATAAADMASSAFAKVNAEAKAALDKVTFTAGSAGSQMMDYIKGGFKGNGNFSFNNVNFNSGSAQLTKTSTSEIDNLAAILKAYPAVNVNIQGHTDNTGDAAKNKTLSQARATAVLGRLMGQGIDASRIKAIGFGSDSPIADNGTAEGRAKNRRIEVSLVK